MHDKNCNNDDCSLERPDYVATERNRFFTGKYMTARDFRADPEYFLSRHRLQNRLLFGWGIVGGLEVHHHPDPRCQDRWVVVSPGMALDCFGREIVLTKEVSFELKFRGDPGFAEGVGLEDDSKYDKSASEVLRQGPTTKSKDLDPAYLLCVRFCEHCVEKVPVLYSDNTCDPKREEFNRIRECPEVRQIPIWQFGSDCWHAPSAVCRSSEMPSSGSDCLCPCREWIPLALVRKGPDKVHIETDGRRQLHFPGKDLTRIIGINWPHGGIYDPDLSEPYDDNFFTKKQELRIRFSRPLHVASEEHGQGVHDSLSGINEATFTLWYHGLSDATAPLTQLQPWHYKKEYVPHVDEKDQCVAVFPLPKHFHDTLIDKMVTIQLLGDFVRDCHQNPPDVTFLGGKPPTGNGLAGGAFHSWFKFNPQRADESSKGT